MVIEVDPGDSERARRGGLDDPARLDAAERQPRRGARVARRRHPGLPEAAARRRRRGRSIPSRAAAASSPTRCASSSRSRATSPASTAASRERRESIARSIHNFRLLSEELGNKDDGADRASSTPPTRCSRSFANQEAAIRESLRELPEHPDARPTRRSAAPTSSRSPRCRRCATPCPARAPGPRCRTLRPFLPRDGGADPRPDPALHRAGTSSPIKHLRQATRGPGQDRPRR